jgi:hypothetical protein
MSELSFPIVLSINLIFKSELIVVDLNIYFKISFFSDYVRLKICLSGSFLGCKYPVCSQEIINWLSCYESENLIKF